jgi:hypothetical protein
MARTVTKIAAEDPRYVDGQDLFEVKDNAFVLGVFTIGQTTAQIDAVMEHKTRQIGIWDTGIATLQQQKTAMEELID